MVSNDLDDYISIHAPVKSATVAEAGNIKLVRDFNPRARKERDVAIDSLSELQMNFNPRARKERDVPITGA